jgi:hypothetical protein
MANCIGRRSRTRTRLEDRLEDELHGVDLRANGGYIVAPSVEIQRLRVVVATGKRACILMVRQGRPPELFRHEDRVAVLHKKSFETGKAGVTVIGKVRP